MRTSTLFNLFFLILIFAFSKITFAQESNGPEKSNLIASSSLQNNDFKVNIYPNPNNGKFNVLTPNNTDPKEVVIFNVIGEKIFNQKFENGIMKCDLTGFVAGLYMVQVYNLTTNKLIVKRFYIE